MPRHPFGPDAPPAGLAHRPETLPWLPTSARPQQPAGRWNTLAVLSLASVAVCAPAAVVLGLIARVQADRRGERGRGLATAGVVAGSLATLLAALVVLVAAAGGTVSTHVSTDPSLPGSSVASVITQQSGGRARGVVCPEDLSGTVGATTTCTATVDGEPTTLRVTTTSTQGDTIFFDVEAVR